MPRKYSILPLSLLLVAACGRDPEARADTTVDSLRSDSLGRSRRDSAAGFVVVDTPPVMQRPGDSARTAPDSTADSVSAKTDTASTPAISVRVAAGRPKRDSLALVYAIRAGNKQAGWPVRGPAPAAGAILPQKRIIAFYGNPLSTRMGILGAHPPQRMLSKLDEVVSDWQQAEPDTPVQPALHVIAVVAQAAPGADGKYRLRMDSSLIEQVYGWARQKNALLFLDIQAGQSTIMEELPPLMKFLERPDVHLGIDPEFYMHHDREGVAPGKKIGTLTAKEINYAIDRLSAVAKEKGLPPKVLVIHRFTRPMVRGAGQIRLDPRVQVVMHMDGWGGPWLKFDSYKDYVVGEPVQFTGFKLFYHNDTKKGDKLLTPMEVLQLVPRPIYIQYQ